MKELTKIAENYAAEKTNEVMTKAIAQAYADGYRDGYKDREEEIPVDLRTDKTEYVDLGLPSGTLWASDYEKKEGGETIYLPYAEATKYNLPTEEQWNELYTTCRWLFKFNNASSLKHFVCVGPNGKFIRFFYRGMVKDGEHAKDHDHVRFWIQDKSDELTKNKISMCYLSGNQITMEKEFKGYGLPVRLVRN